MPSVSCKCHLSYTGRQMRILFAAHNCYTDNTSGAARSMRTITEWMAQMGHECRALGTSRFDGAPPASIWGHLDEMGVRPERVEMRRMVRSGSASRPVYRFGSGGVEVTMLDTRRNDLARPDADESEQMLFLLRHMLKEFEPEVLLAYGAHPVVGQMMGLARQRGARTVFSLRNIGYEHRRWFEDVDSVLTNSPFLSRHYEQAIGLDSTPIVSPIEWADALAPDESRVMLTFVNPSLAKGAGVFARLADMLGSERPDIPILVVQSSSDATSLNSIPGIDFSKYPQIMAAPPVPRPRDFLELTRVLLVPSVFPEPFGRVAVEAMLNGIVPVVSERGALPETVGDGGVVLPLPDWLTPAERRIPDEDEVRPWFDEVCRLFDDEDYYQRRSAVARAEAEARYSERALRRHYDAYFRSVAEGRSPS